MMERRKETSMRKLLFILMLCLFGISCELAKLDLQQQKLDAKELEHMARASEVVLQINSD